MAGQDVFVLTSILENGENRPVAVTTDEHVANEWVRAGNDNDWISFTLDDLSTTGLAKEVTPFKPKQKMPAEEAIKNINDQLVKQNQELQEVVQLLQKRIQMYEKRMGYKSSAENPLFEKSAGAPGSHLYHGTSEKAYKAIIRNDYKMTAPSYWATLEVAEYYAEVAAEEDGSNIKVVIEMPIGLFSSDHLAPDDNSIAEPLTYTLGMTETDLYDQWQSSDGTWEDSLEIYGSVKYNAVVDIRQGNLV